MEDNGQVTNFFNLFLDNWSKTPDHVHGTDFPLHSTFDDAKKGSKPWKYIDYGGAGVGFPGKSGPEAETDDQWNSITGSGVQTYGFYVETPGK